jgi:hypothetical protein
MARLFDAMWDASYTSAHTRTVSVEFFASCNGYDDADLRQVDALAVGEIAMLDGRHHFVKRLL